jgi:hypothetical protein
MDTMGGDEPEDGDFNNDIDYQDREDDDQNSENDVNSDNVDRLSVDLDDLQDEDDSDEAIDLSKDNRKDSLQSLAYTPSGSTEDSGEKSNKALKIGDLFTVS